MAGEKTRGRPHRKAKYAAQFTKTALNKERNTRLHNGGVRGLVAAYPKAGKKAPKGA